LRQRRAASRVEGRLATQGALMNVGPLARHKVAATLIALVASSGWPAIGRATVTEPDGMLTVPINGASSPDLACCNNTLNNMSLDALFKSRGEAIDYQKDAAIEPAAFSPLCGLSGSMVLHGGGCKVDFGWYCTSDADPPTVHPLVTAQEVVAFHDGPETPLIWKNNDNMEVVVTILDYLTLGGKVHVIVQLANGDLRVVPQTEVKVVN